MNLEDSYQKCYLKTTTATTKTKKQTTSTTNTTKANKNKNRQTNNNNKQQPTINHTKNIKFVAMLLLLKIS